MKYINFNEDDFIDWLSKEKGVFFLELADLKDYFKEYNFYLISSTPITLEEIKYAVEVFSNCRDISVRLRDRNIVYLREIYYLLSKEYTPYSLYKIGSKVFRNHASVLHGLNQALINFNQPYYNEYRDIYNNCKQHLNKRKDNIKLQEELLKKEL